MTPCRCPAYPFPHRKNGGDCCPESREVRDEGAADRWLASMILNPSRMGIPKESSEPRNRF